MKKTNYFILAAAAALFAACSSDDGLAPEQKTVQNEQVPVAFDSYVNRSTRAGQPGELTTANLKSSTNGFGVFAYYTDNQPYGAMSTPDFMYNQKVTYDGTSAWTYTPVKYWPNEYGTGAESFGQDRLTFFAYAPYVKVTPGTGRLNTGTSAVDAAKSGIVGLTSNTATGDPYVKYYVDFNPANSVDLCWGVAAAQYTSSVENSHNDIKAGDPYINVLKPAVGGNIKFDFKHALASLNVQIDADVNKKTHVETDAVDKNTRIWVRSVTFEGFADKGSLNLNSTWAADATTPQWYELSSTNTPIGAGSTTVCDGRIDGKEGQGSAAANNETIGLNTILTQGAAYVKWTPDDGLKVSEAYTGVTNVNQNLFNSATPGNPVFVIPNGQPLKVTIVYDVETYDENLAGYLSDGKTKGKSVENKITKAITTTTGDSPAAITMAAGKKYTINLHLGMTSVEFEATVADWGEPTTGESWLPINNE